MRIVSHRTWLGWVAALLMCAACDDASDQSDCRGRIDDTDFVYKCDEGIPWDSGQERPPRPIGADGSSSECAVAADCRGLVDSLFECIPCSGGEHACPVAECSEGKCVATFSELCPELERAFACETDADCDEPCLHQCADATPACLDTPCSDGVCHPRVATCGLASERCPPGSLPYHDCIACGPVDACSMFEISCAQTCESDGDCTRDGTHCSKDGFCDVNASVCDV
jgi:hypothetical protein